MWQAFRNKVHTRGLEVVTVGMDTLGVESCKPFIDAAQPEHPSLIDVNHVMAEQFGVVNIPNGIWIDEDGVIVRPAEPAYAPGGRTPTPSSPPVGLPQHMVDIMTEAAKISNDRDAYGDALYDWIDKGADSKYALSPAEVIARSVPRGAPASQAAAHFVLAQHLWNAGHRDAAITHFRTTHRLDPGNFSYKRQAWSLFAPTEAGPFARFWQGPEEGREDEWPFDSDWVTEVRAMGAENYYPEFKA